MSNVNPTRAIAMATLSASRADADVADQRRAAKAALSRSHLTVAHLEQKLAVELQKEQRMSENVGYAMDLGSKAYGATAPKADTGTDVATKAEPPEPSKLREAITAGFNVAPHVQKLHDRALERELSDATDAERAARRSAGRSDQDAQRERAATRAADKMIDHLWELVGSQ